MQEYNHADEILLSSQGHRLYIGDAQAAEDTQWLRENNVRTVITAASGFHFKYEPTVKHITYDLQDKKTQSINAYFDMASFQIDKHLRSNAVLVHCGAGVSRSPTLVIAYLIKYKHMTFHDALKLLKSKRPQVCPNLGFQLQLKSYQKSHKAPLGMFLVRTRKKQKLEHLPDIVKYVPMHTTSYNNSFKMQASQPLNRNSNLGLSKSLKPVQSRQKRQIQYLRKMAQFRFGITNMSKWKIGTLHGEPKPLQL